MSYFRTLLATSLLAALPMSAQAEESESWYKPLVQINETNLEVALTGNSQNEGDLQDAENLIPEAIAEIKLGLFENAIQMSVKAIQEDDLETLGDTTFNKEWTEEVIKELNIMFTLGMLDVVVGDHAAIGGSEIAQSNDIRRRDSITSQTEQSLESVSGIQIALNQDVKISDNDMMVVQKVNDLLSNVTVSIFNGNSRDDLLDFDDLNSMAINSQVELAGIQVKMSLVDAETENGDEKIYILGAEKDLSSIADGLKAYAEYQNFEEGDDTAREQDSKFLVGISKDFRNTDFAKNSLPQKVVAGLLTNTVLSGEYARVERSSLGQEDSDVFMANATRHFSDSLSIGAQVSHDDDNDETALKIRARKRF